MKNKKILLVILGLVILGTIGFLYREKSALSAIILPKPFTDLVGTRTASTTVPVGWYGNFVASTTYPFPLFGASDAIVVFDIGNASTSASAVSISVLGSNDPNCSTATTSTIYNLMTKAQIRWFDAGSYLDGATVVSSFSNGTTTVFWNNPSGNQRALKFTDLSMECLAMEVNASSTQVYAHYKLKD